jgi:hypothetical protein
LPLSTSSQKNDDNNSILKTKQSFPPNSSIVPSTVANRNPRNLEKLRIAERITGWDLDKEGRSFWNKYMHTKIFCFYLNRLKLN